MMVIIAISTMAVITFTPILNICTPVIFFPPFLVIVGIDNQARKRYYFYIGEGAHLPLFYQLKFIITVASVIIAAVSCITAVAKSIISTMYFLPFFFFLLIAFASFLVSNEFVLSLLLWYNIS